MNHTDDIVATMIDLYRGGFAKTGGNISTRHASGFYITPTGASKLLPDAFCADQIVSCDLDGKPNGNGSPSRETPIHVAIYANMLWAGAIIHAHSPAIVSVFRSFEIDQGLTEASLKLPKPLIIKNDTILSTSQLLSALSQDGCIKWLKTVRGQAYGEWIFVNRHGVFVIGRSLPDARYLLYKLDESAQSILFAGLLAGLRGCRKF